ncbi:MULTISPECIES: DUF3040 domain-containing protein [unclassified Streptomyces]|uniref:DUF3040 domain-containing protein n=1 Tax=unclassified Streptomyces TaxID=2593676 RepID=UPI000A673AF9|nr:MULTISPECIES: DUF3040 domain-containing protein [unclassified Streptomyces]AZM59239.1 hypothetical protein DLM49_06400 [Streptomyces sp. WAC 01438]RSM87245.1 hypothetical protein DMA10_35855 [Streptomyces sp. WAC 01420]
MSIGRLPEHEQHILDEIERTLRRDRRLDRRLRTLTMRRGPDITRPLRRAAGYRPRRWTVAALLTVAVALMVTGIMTSAPWAIWAFAGVWPVALFAAFRLLCRWSGG